MHTASLKGLHFGNILEQKFKRKTDHTKIFSVKLAYFYIIFTSKDFVKTHSKSCSLDIVFLQYQNGDI